MNKNYVIAIVVIILIVTGYFLWNRQTTQTFAAHQYEKVNDTISYKPVDTVNSMNRKSSIVEPDLQTKEGSIPTNKQDTSITLIGKTYINYKWGFKFEYPSSWVKQGNDAEVINRSGNVVAVGIYFSDTLSKTTFTIDYHLAPTGAVLYKTLLSQFKSSQGWYAKDSRQIKVAGNEAIEAYTVLNENGKGKKIVPALRFIKVDFLNKEGTGEFELQFQTPLPKDNIEVTKFKELLSTFQFTK